MSLLLVFFDGLSDKEKFDAVEKFFPLFNSANYTFDIIKFAREAFYPGFTDDQILSELRRFYDAHENMEYEELAKLKFNIEEKYRKKTSDF